MEQINNSVDRQYFQLLNHILKNGVKKEDRTGTGTLSVFDYTMRFDMSEGFPLLTSKKMFTKGVIHELIWFLRGDTNIKYLVDNDVHIWDGDAFKNYINKTNEFKGDWPDTLKEFIERIKTDNEFAEKWGELGPIYGKQWREWSNYRQVDTDPFVCEYRKEDPIDQIQNLIYDLKTNPDSRRLLVSAWNCSDLDSMVLPPCHYGFQCYTVQMNTYERKKWWCDSLDKSIHYAEDLTDGELDSIGVPRRRLSLKWNQRSVDTFLGLPFNIASYALLLHLLAKEVNMVPHELIFSGGDVHLYTNHVEQAKEQLGRKTFKLPKLILNNKSIFELRYEDIQIINYQSDKVLKGELSN